VISRCHAAIITWLAGRCADHLAGLDRTNVLA